MNLMQAYFELREINKNLEKIQQQMIEIEMDDPKLQEASQAVEKARSMIIHAVEEFELTLSID